MARKPLYEPFDLIYAFDMAVSFLELEEWPEDDNGSQMAAYAEAAKRIRAMAKRESKKQFDLSNKGVRLWRCCLGSK
jgi:hypothetical protein